MSANKKDLFHQIKNSLKNKEQLREQLSQNLNLGKQIFESQAKHIIKQAQDVIKNKEQIGSQVKQSLELGKQIAESQAKSVFKQAKKSHFFKETIVPLAESEATERALKTLSTTLHLKNTMVMKHVENLRREIIDTKVSKAKDVEPILTPSNSAQDFKDHAPTVDTFSSSKPQAPSDE